jgi:hypothetical protein
MKVGHQKERKNAAKKVRKHTYILGHEFGTLRNDISEFWKD